MTAIFVTATGTDIGKTFVTAGLIRHFRAAGRAVEAIKPVVSGFDPAALQTSDPGVLLAALGRPVTIEEIDRISPWRFAAPLSPDLAAAREGRAIGFDALLDFSRRPAKAGSILFIEGVGGIMVPLDDKHTVLDWMTALRIPLLLVVGSYLGTISHTLTALHVLAQRSSTSPRSWSAKAKIGGATLDETVASIARFAQPIDVIGVPRLLAKDVMGRCRGHAIAPRPPVRAPAFGPGSPSCTISLSRRVRLATGRENGRPDRRLPRLQIPVRLLRVLERVFLVDRDLHLAARDHAEQVVGDRQQDPRAWRRRC